MNILLKEGSKGTEVIKLQKLLCDAGYKVLSDGWFGDGTEKAVIKFQKDNDLVVDGIVGPRTFRLLEGKVTTDHALTQQNIIDAAEFLGVEPAAISAVSTVESSGSGFLSPGVPKILFERHWMWRRLVTHGFDVDNMWHEHPTIICKKPGGYQGGHAEQLRLQEAKKIHYQSAIESASWGRYQIMGFHWEALGYSSAEEWETLMCKNEGEQLNAFVRFIKNSSPLHNALRKKQWGNFASRYNGPAYKKYSYDTKMKAAYEKAVEIYSA